MPSLDLGANAFRQNGSIKDDHALRHRASAQVPTYPGNGLLPGGLDATAGVISLQAEKIGDCHCITGETVRP